MPLKIIAKERHSASPPPGHDQSWTEYQIRDGRRVIERCDTYAEALRRMAEREYLDKPE